MTDVKLVDIVPHGQGWRVVNVGTGSQRQFRAAMEGSCPACGSDLLEREVRANSRFIWGVCFDCLWAEAFRANTGKEHHTIWRIISSGNHGILRHNLDFDGVGP